MGRKNRNNAADASQPPVASDEAEVDAPEEQEEGVEAETPPDETPPAAEPEAPASGLVAYVSPERIYQHGRLVEPGTPFEVPASQKPEKHWRPYAPAKAGGVADAGGASTKRDRTI